MVKSDRRTPNRIPCGIPTDMVIIKVIRKAKDSSLFFFHNCRGYLKSTSPKIETMIIAAKIGIGR
jgi:hypothetical protein